MFAQWPQLFKKPRTLKIFYNTHKIYQSTMNKSNSDKVNCISNNLITGQGIVTLQGSSWLDDEVINAYFQLVANSSDLYIFYVNTLNYQTFKDRHILNHPYSLNVAKCY